MGTQADVSPESTAVTPRASAAIEAAPERVRRRGFDAVVALGGTLVLAVSSALALRDELHAAEIGANRALNTLPEHGRLLWPVMQLGNLAAVPVIAGVAWRLSGSMRLGTALLTSGFGAWLVSKPVKSAVGRDRPAGHIEDVNVREHAAGLGFVSGHAAVATALATTLNPHLPVRRRWLPPLLAGLVGLSRVYYGAHLPLDVVGGAGLGAAIGATANLALGVPDRGGTDVDEAEASP